MAVQRIDVGNGAINAAFIVQEGAAGRRARTFTNAQLAQASDIADTFQSFIKGAKSSIHMAIYDFRLDGDAASKVIDALNERAKAGIDVRIAFFESPHQPTPEAFTLLGSDPAVVDDGLGGASFDNSVTTRGIKQDLGQATLAPPVVGEAIEPPHNLMHSKYIIRDGLTQNAALLMGSANFTTDAWSVQDNNILVLEKCQTLSAYYENDFSEMWQSGLISNTGNFDTADVEVGGLQMKVLFAPGRGRQIGGEIAARIDTAKKRLLVASMVISSGPIMGAISDRMHRVETFGGIYDGPQMRMVLEQWGKSRSHAEGPAPASRRAAASGAKAQQFEAIAEFMHYKKSLPFVAKGVHNFMHDKFAVVDDLVITGSFNFSTNAQNNAENVLMIQSKELADAYAEHFAALIKAYPDTGVPQATAHHHSSDQTE